MKTKILVLSILVLAVLLFSIGCSSKGRTASCPSFDSNTNYRSPLSQSHHRSGETLESETIARKISYTASISLVVKNIDTASVCIVNIAEKYGGYMLNTRNSFIRIQVVANELEAALEDISGLGKVESKSITGTDVTEEFTDLRIRLENAERFRDRYLQLLEQAENVETALKVEKELERVTETIDRLKGRINSIENSVEYSGISISLREQVKPGVFGYIGIGLFHTIRWLFVR